MVLRVKEVVYLAENTSSLYSRLTSAISKFIFKKCNVKYNKYEEIDKDNINIMVLKMKTEDEKDIAFFEKKLQLKKDNNN